jgi:hypothetical protein
VDFARQLRDVLDGNLDVGIVSSGWLEDNFPEKMSQLLIHPSNLSTNVYNIMGIPTLFQSEPIPFAVSTDLVALAGLSAAPAIPTHLRENILQALLRLDPAEHPAMHPAGLAKFTIPSSCAYPRTLAVAAGIMTTADSESRTLCLGPLEHGVDLVRCPKNTLLGEVGEVLDSCRLDGIPCPEDLACLCRPCRPVGPVNYYPWPVVLGLCCGLFLVGAWFSVCWFNPVDSVYMPVVSQIDLLSGVAQAVNLKGSRSSRAGGRAGGQGPQGSGKV